MAADFGSSLVANRKQGGIDTSLLQILHQTHQRAIRGAPKEI